MGGLGAGGYLMNIIIAQLESEDVYDFLVLQATGNAVTFYESLGFVRVGATAKYFRDDLYDDIDEAPVVGYRHWTYPDQLVSKMPSVSYMMARRLVHSTPKAKGKKHSNEYLKLLEARLAPRPPKVHVSGKCTQAEAEEYDSKWIKMYMEKKERKRKQKRSAQRKRAREKSKVKNKAKIEARQAARVGFVPLD